METEGETEEQNKYSLSVHSVRTYCSVRDQLSHAHSHKSGPMPKVKEALLPVTTGVGAATLLYIRCLCIIM